MPSTLTIPIYMLIFCSVFFIWLRNTCTSRLNFALHVLGCWRRWHAIITSLLLYTILPFFCFVYSYCGCCCCWWWWSHGIHRIMDIIWLHSSIIISKVNCCQMTEKSMVNFLTPNNHCAWIVVGDIRSAPNDFEPKSVKRKQNCNFASLQTLPARHNQS